MLFVTRIPKLTVGKLTSSRNFKSSFLAAGAETKRLSHLVPIFMLVLVRAVCDCKILKVVILNLMLQLDNTVHQVIMFNTVGYELCTVYSTMYGTSR